MKRFLLLAVFLSIVSPVYGQVSLGTSASSTNPQRSGDATTGLFSPTIGAVSISSAGTEIVHVNGVGVGIGTSSPSQTLQLYSTSDYLPQTVWTNVDNTGGSAPYGIFQKARGGPAAVQLGDALGTFLFQGYGGGGYQTSSYFNAVVDGTPSGTTVPSAIAYANGATETIRFSSNNRVGIGSTTPVVSLDVSQKTDALALPVGTTAQRPTGSNGMIRYNTTTTGLEAYINSAWASLSGGVGGVAGSAGQLQCSGANCTTTTGSGTLNYCPYKGNVKTTASQGNYTIPSACLAATLTSMYVGGVASSSVSASTLYYIYLWSTSGTWVLDAETTGHATDSSTGIEIKSGDSSKTLVGMIHTDANKHVMSRGQTTSGMFDTNTVATWDNRIPTVTRCGFTVNRTETATSSTEVNSENRCYFMNWGDAAVITSSQGGFNNTTGVLHSSGLQIDGLQIVAQLNLENTANYPEYLNPSGTQVTGEGFHYTVLTGATISGSTITYYGGAGAAYTQVYTLQ